MLPPIVKLIDLILGFYSFIVFAYILIQLLYQFNVISRHNQFIAKLSGLFGDLVEPVLAKIRKYIKPIGAVDLSPVILLFSIYMLQYCLYYYFS